MQRIAEIGMELRDLMTEYNEAPFDDKASIYSQIRTLEIERETLARGG